MADWVMIEMDNSTVSKYKHAEQFTYFHHLLQFGSVGPHYILRLQSRLAVFSHSNGNCSTHIGPSGSFVNGYSIWLRHPGEQIYSKNIFDICTRVPISSPKLHTLIKSGWFLFIRQFNEYEWPVIMYFLRKSCSRMYPQTKVKKTSFSGLRLDIFLHMLNIWLTRQFVTANGQWSPGYPCDYL